MKYLIVITALLLPNIALAKPVVVKHAYPNDAKTAFLKSCISNNEKMKKHCACMLIGLQNSMNFQEFVALSALENPQQDGRFANVVGQCIQVK